MGTVSLTAVDASEAIVKLMNCVRALRSEQHSPNSQTFRSIQEENQRLRARESESAELLIRMAEKCRALAGERQQLKPFYELEQIDDIVNMRRLDGKHEGALHDERQLKEIGTCMTPSRGEGELVSL